MEAPGNQHEFAHLANLNNWNVNPLSSMALNYLYFKLGLPLAQIIQNNNKKSKLRKERTISKRRKKLPYQVWEVASSLQPSPSTDHISLIHNLLHPCIGIQFCIELSLGGTHCMLRNKRKCKQYLCSTLCSFSIPLLALWTMH